MKLCVIIALCALLTLSQQALTNENCVCELTNTDTAFPHEKLSTLGDDASKCNGNITPQKTLELERLLLGLEQRLPQLEEDVSVLEKEDDGELYGVISLQLIENEMLAIQQLIDRLNGTAMRHQRLTLEATKQLEDMRAEMQTMEMYDTMQVVKRQQDNVRLKRDLDQCTNRFQHIIQATKPSHGSCFQGEFVNITGPRVYTAGEYPGSYKYGAWGRDPKPEAGKESWHWMVILTSGNKYAHYVRLYTSLSSLIVGVSSPGNFQISPSNPTTNTIQGPNVVLYGGALYYNCYNQNSLCRFNLTTKSVSTLKLPQGTRYNSKANFCHIDECYPFTDIDLATDESGVWVIYTTSQDFGNLVLSQVKEGDPPTLGQTWHTSIYKLGVTNTFVICGVLYATRFVDKNTEEIFYSFDTTTGVERFNVGIFIKKMNPNIYFLNYSPVDQMLHAYCDAYMVSYKVLFS